jgi:4-amino-4-deoxy-L-arabinose transferase-like glycosyltransferase
MLVAVLNSLVWAFLTPLFQVPDEPVHIGYAEYVATSGKLPRDVGSSWLPGPEASRAFALLPFSITGHPNWLESRDRTFHRAVDSAPHRAPETGAGYIANNPPLYYALQALPDRLAGGGNFLDRVMAMRIFSALLAALTTGFVFMFVRELLPGDPWTWPVGALAVAFQPVFGFISGGVNNDTLLWTASAGLLWAIARAFRCGLTVRRGAGIGAAAAAAFLTKGTAYALLPGTALAVLIMVWRGRHVARAAVMRGATAAAAVGCVPIAGWVLASRYAVHRSGGAVTAGYADASHGSIGGQLSYLWQFWLPKLPSMHDWFPDYYPVWDSYLQAFVGRFGWFQYGFPLWVNRLGLAVAVIVLFAAVASLVRARGALRRRWSELVTYGVFAAGVAVLVNVAGYRYLLDTSVRFEQVRYLFPLLPLYGGLIAVAARVGGRRVGPALAVGFLVLAIADSVFSQLLTISRYYA